MADPTAVIAAARELLAEASKYDALIDRRVLYALRAEFAAYDSGAGATVVWKPFGGGGVAAHVGDWFLRAEGEPGTRGRFWWAARRSTLREGYADTQELAQAAAEAAARGATP